MAIGRVPGATGIQPTIVDAKGDIIAATAADSVTRLAVGTTNGHVLKVNSSTATGLEWGADGTGMTLLETLTLSGATTVSSTIPGTYSSLQVVVRNFLPANDNIGLCVRFNGDSTANRYYVGGAVTGGSFNQSLMELTNGSDNSVAQGLIIFNIPDYANATTWKTIQSIPTVNNATTTTTINFDPRTGVYNQTGAITTLTFLAATGNLTSGTVLIYGVK